jgi:putative hemolysin
LPSLIGWQFILCGIFYLASAMFSASETALTSLSRPRLKKMISQRPALATTFREWLAAPEYLLTTILVGNTLSNIFVALLTVNIAFALFPKVHHGIIETATWLLMTVLLFVFADYLPKSLARHYPQRVALASIRIVSALSRWSTPVIRVLLKILDKFPIFEGEPVGKLSVYSLEELREMIQAGAHLGTVPQRSTQMMEGALRLHRIPVSQIMTPIERVESVNLGMETEHLLDQIAEIGHTRIPAYRASPKKIGGYLHAKDLLYAWRGALPLKLDILLRAPLFVPPGYIASNLLEEFKKGSSHLAVVTDAVGDALGIVTLQDVLEEVVGEILQDAPNPELT